MTRVGKLYAWLLANPRGSVPFRDFQRLLEAFGFELVRIAGSHHQYAHPKVSRILTITPRGKEAKSYQIQQFITMIGEFELTMDG